MNEPITENKPLVKKEFDNFIKKYSNEIKEGYINISRVKSNSTIDGNTIEITTTQVEIIRMYKQPIKDKKWLDYINTQLKNIGFKNRNYSLIHVSAKIKK
jgi:hypothetical protein